MALMEADGGRFDDARNALGAMINRAAKSGEDLGAHVSRRIYQPTIEPAQQRRLGRLMASPSFSQLTDWAQRRSQGLEPDPVGGATHFLAHPNVMLRLSGGVRPNGRGGYVGNSRKYHSWPGWTGFDPRTGTYRNQTTTDRSHAFLAPEGLHSVKYTGLQNLSGTVAGAAAPLGAAGGPTNPRMQLAGSGAAGMSIGQPPVTPTILNPGTANQPTSPPAPESRMALGGPPAPPMQSGPPLPSRNPIRGAAAPLSTGYRPATWENVNGTMTPKFQPSPVAGAAGGMIGAPGRKKFMGLF